MTTEHLASNPTPPAHPSVSTSPAPHAAANRPDKIIVYRHSNLFYWWPVWAIGFLFAIITYFDHHHLAIVPANTQAYEKRLVDVDGKGRMEERQVLILDPKHKLWKRPNDEGDLVPVQPTIYVTHFKTLGTLYAIVLLVVIGITNIMVRGLWTVFFIMSIVMLTIIFAVAGWWEMIFQRFNQLSIYLNMGGYLLISTVLLILWLVNFLFFDRQTYLIFTPGQVRVRLEIGGEETVYDATGMVVQRERADLFRHWILGFGSGDLIIRPAGLSHPLLFPNVLRVGKITEGIERMMKEKVIVRAPGEK
jgi:hypothetical protein